jgi:NADPH:quinone reductase
MKEPRNRVVQVTHFGGPDGLEVIDAPLPTAGRGEVRVRLLASGLEYTDVLIRRHLYPQTMHRRAKTYLGRLRIIGRTTSYCRRYLISLHQ